MASQEEVDILREIAAAAEEALELRDEDFHKFDDAMISLGELIERYYDEWWEE